MRKIFASYLLEEMKKNEKIVIITADIGYGVLDEIRKQFSERFFNVGSSEALMIGMAIGFCYEGYVPICYTITPFLLYRPFDMIRNYVNYEVLNIKLVGSGRDKDYSKDGFSHWCEDDVDILTNSFPNIKLYKPLEFTKELFLEVINNTCPCYLNLKRDV